MNWITVHTEKDIPLEIELLVQLNNKRYTVLKFFFDNEFQRFLASDYEGYICTDEVKRFVKII